MLTVLDLAILDSGNSDAAVALGRSQTDIATATLPFGNDFDELIEFRDDLDRVMRHGRSAPSDQDLADFGRALFEYCIRDDVRRLFDALPTGEVSLQILSNNSDVQKVPWELMQPPGQNGPNRRHCVVRVVPTIGCAPLKPRKRKKATSILFAAADPIDQNQPVSWPEVKDSIERTFSQLPQKFDIFVEKAVTRQGLVAAVAERAVDIFHFSGHGEPGFLILENRESGSSYRLAASDLANILGGKVKLVILSACDTAAGDFDDEFGVTAATLIQQGIPAVVANQMPIPNATVARFISSFYQELIRSGNIDNAMMEGRLMLSVDVGSFVWGIPTLYRHFGGAQIYRA